MARPERQTSATIRGAALIAIGALALHQARYLLASGELAAAAHGYLGLLLPLVATGACAAIALTIAAATRRAPVRARPADVTERAIAYAAALFSAYLVQETVEGVVVAGHGGLAATLTGAGAWLALPLAIAIGALAAFAARWLDRVEVRVAAAAARPATRRAPRRSALPRPPARRALATRSLAFGIARRPPPLPLAG